MNISLLSKWILFLHVTTQHFSIYMFWNFNRSKQRAQCQPAEPTNPSSLATSLGTHLLAARGVGSSNQVIKCPRNTLNCSIKLPFNGRNDSATKFLVVQIKGERVDGKLFGGKILLCLIWPLIFLINLRNIKNMESCRNLLILISCEFLPIYAEHFAVYLEKHLKVILCLLCTISSVQC